MSVATKGVAVVTGSAQGIGRAIALRLAKDSFNVSLNDIQSNKEKLEQVADEIVSVDRKAFSFVGDVSKEKDVQSLVNTTVRELGSLNVMVANAGVSYWNPLIELDSTMLEKTLDVNVKGVIYCYKYAALQMIKQGNGCRILGATSTAGKQGHKELLAYCASKSAVRGLTQSAALELGKHGITVNAYAPGAIDTDMMVAFGEIWAKKNGVPLGTFSELCKDMSPLQRIGTSDDIASLVSF